MLSLVEFIVMLYQLLCHKDTAQGTQSISFLSLVLHGIRIGGFHAVKGSYIGVEVSNNRFSLCMSSYHSVFMSISDHCNAQL